MRGRHVPECYVASRAQRQSRREDQPFDELASRDLLVRVKRLIRKQVDDVTAEQKLDTVFRPVAANIDRAWRLRPCGQSGSSGSDEDDDRDGRAWCEEYGSAGAGAFP